ncbi:MULTISPECIES: mechanosensitive ion channel [unclassified Moraxella]|uniref:mechanosensitive ion channel n=1 Tax=unclassified Moraxella TaxID=2685852 RepID=UPI003AF4BDE7
MENFFLNFNQTLGSSVVTMIGALLIFVIGWIIAGIIGSVVHKLMVKLNINQKMNASTGKSYDLAHLISRIVFWFVFIIAIAASLSFLKLDAISGPFASMISQVLSFIPNLLGAIALGVLGWVLATVARTALAGVLNRTSLDEKLTAEAGVEPMSANIANIAYWFILLMFLPLVLQQLNLTGLLTPVNNMIGKTLEFIPNIVIAGVLLFVGYVIAKIVRGIVTNVVASLNIQSVANKAGMGNQLQIANIAGTLVYLLVMITTIIMALDALKIESISRPATNMLNEIMSAIPNIIAAVAILGIAYYVVKFVANIVKNLLENTGVNALPAKLGCDAMLGNTKVSDLIGSLIVFFAMLFASIEAANRLGFSHISDLISMFIEFGAQVLLGAVILAVGFWLANLLAGAVQRSQSGTTFLANLVRVLIMGLVLAMGLRAMGIADSIVNMAFGLTLGAVAVAFALAFGLGGREAAGRLLKNLQDKAEVEAKNIATKQNAPTNVDATFDANDLQPKP